MPSLVVSDVVKICFYMKSKGYVSTIQIQFYSYYTGFDSFGVTGVMHWILCLTKVQDSVS